MPPRHAYWTIILEGKPTAFRAHTEAELVPTFRQLQSKHPDVVMKWFSRGRLWSSPEEERAAVAQQRRRRPEHRDRSWRPGGAHQDPRERFKVPRDEKRRRFADRLRRDWRDRQGGDREGQRPPGAPAERPWRPKPKPNRPGTGRPHGPGGFRPRGRFGGGPRRGGGPRGGGPHGGGGGGRDR